MDHLTNPESWIVFLITLLTVALVTGIHYEVLSFCQRYLPRISHARRRRVLFLISFILVTHVAEMWIFAFGYYTTSSLGGMGSLLDTTLGVPQTTLPEIAYFSAMVYTTVGFGDVLPTGHIRFMAGMEAVTGLVMIAWSASFTYIVMQHDWPAVGGRA